MHLFLTGVLPFLAHNHPSAVAFLTCRHHNFHSSIIPEFLSDEERVQSFFGARPAIREFWSSEDASRNNARGRETNYLKADKGKQYKRLYNLFVQTPLMQFSPALVLHRNDCVESILQPLLETKYFTRTLQQCSVGSEVEITNDLLQALSKVRSLIKLDLQWKEIEHDHLEIIINSYLNLEKLRIRGNGAHLKKIDTKVVHTSLLKSLRCLTAERVYSRFAIRFVPRFPNLRELELSAVYSGQRLDLLPLTSSLALLVDLELHDFIPDNTDSLKNLVHLSSLLFTWCQIGDLNFLTHDSHPHLSTLRIRGERIGRDRREPSSFASLTNAPNLQDLEVSSELFDNDCLQHLENMVYLRKLDLSDTYITGESESFKTLIQNLLQLEDLNLMECDIGNQCAISGALYSSHNRLRVLNLSHTHLVDDDLNGIGALKNTLEVLDLSDNRDLTSESLVHCKDLIELKTLTSGHCDGIDDLSPLKDCVNLEELDVSSGWGLSDDSFKVFRDEPNSFPNLHRLNLSNCYENLTEKVFEHLAKNNHVVYQLKELSVQGMSEVLSSSSTARNNICQFTGLRKGYGILSSFESESDRKKLRTPKKPKGELMQRLRNLEEIN